MLLKPIRRALFLSSFLACRLSVMQWASSPSDTMHATIGPVYVASNVLLLKGSKTFSERNAK